MYYKLYLVILCLHLSWSFANSASNTTNINVENASFKYVTGSPDIPLAIKDSPPALPRIPVSKTEVHCVNYYAHRTTVAYANAMIFQLSQVPWINDNITWSRSIRTRPGHLPLKISTDTTQINLFPRYNTSDEDTMVLADYLEVLRNIVKDCIAQSQYTGGRAYIGSKGFVGISLTGNG